MPSTSLRILRTCYSRSWGGLEMQALEVTDALLHRGHTVWLSCLPDTRLMEEATQRGITTVPLNVRGYAHPIIATRLARFLRRERVAVIHTELSKDLATIVAATRISRRTLPIILTKHMGSYINKKDILHQITYGHVSRVIAISDFVRQNVLDTTPMSPSQVVTIHNAVDLKHYDPSRVDRSRVRRELGIEDRTLAVGHVARFSPGKGHEDLLHAAAIVVRQRQDVRFLFLGAASYGEEPYEAEIKALARQLGLEQRVSFLGFRSDIPEIMGALDVFAFPSHAEAFGMALIEAMAMECAVVSTNSYGVVDIVVDGVTGIMVPPRSPEEFAKALVRLLADPGQRKAMGLAGRARVVAVFQREAQLNRIEQVYREVITEGGKHHEDSKE